MALARRFKIEHDDVFGCGAFLVSEVTPVLDFDKSTKDNRVQALDKDTGVRLWAVDVLDADPEARKASKTVSVKIAAPVQPVPPAAASGMPFTAVRFEGLTALPYVDDNGSRPRLAWSFRAEAMTAPGKSTSSASPGAGSAAARGSEAA
jgi:hypothetical protein